MCLLVESWDWCLLHFATFSSFRHLIVNMVIYRCTGILRLWSSLQRVENRNLFTEVCARLEATARDTFTQHGWQHDLRIGAPSTLGVVHTLHVSCISPFFILILLFNKETLFGCMHLSYVEDGYNA